MRWLLILLLPLALAAQQTDSSVHVMFFCGNNRVAVEYMAAGDVITLFYTEKATEEVARSFLVYFKLLNTFDRLNFLSPGTIASLSSLSESMEDYALQLLQAKTLAEKGKRELDLGELNRLADLVRKRAYVLSTKADRLRRQLKKMIERPGCYPVPDLSLFSEFDSLYRYADELLEKAQRLKTQILSDENIQPDLMNALTKLITPPLERSSLDELRARRDADREVLTAVFFPDKEEVVNLLRLSQSYADYKKTEKAIREDIITELGIFHGIEEAVDFTLKNKARLERRDLVERVENLYNQLRKAMDEKDYAKAYELATSLRYTIMAALNGGWKKEEKEGSNPPVMYLVVLIIVALLIIGVVLRRRKDEGTSEDIDALELPYP